MVPHKGKGTLLAKIKGLKMIIGRNSVRYSKRMRSIVCFIQVLRGNVRRVSLANVVSAPYNETKLQEAWLKRYFIWVDVTEYLQVI